MRFRDLSQLGMTVFVVSEMNTALANLFVGKRMKYALGNDSSTVIHPHDFTLHDGRYNQFHDFIDRDFGFVEHLGNDNHRVVASLSDTERQVSRTAAHRSQHKPVSAGTCIDINGPSDHGTLVFSRFVTESRCTVRKREVIVDGLRNVDIGNRIPFRFEELGNAVGRRSRIVTAHGHQQLDIVIGEEFQIEVVFEIGILRFETAHLEERTALIEYSVGHLIINVHRTGIGDEQTGISFVQADYAIAFA